MREPKIYFHQLSDEAVKELIDNKIPIERIRKEHPKPTWCGYPHAIDEFGCWKLMDFYGKRNFVNRESCDACPCNLKLFKQNNYGK